MAILFQATLKIIRSIKQGNVLYFLVKGKKSHICFQETYIYIHFYTPDQAEGDKSDIYYGRDITNEINLTR